MTAVAAGADLRTDPHTHTHPSARPSLKHRPSSGGKGDERSCKIPCPKFHAMCHVWTRSRRRREKRMTESRPEDDG